MQESNWLEILKSNQGLSNPERVHYAQEHYFTRIRAEKIGEYIYYSTLINLKLCPNCGLLYADTEIDPQVIQKHFESTYKAEDYFMGDRDQIKRKFDTVTLIGVLLLRIEDFKILVFFTAISRGLRCDHHQSCRTSRL